MNQKKTTGRVNLAKNKELLFFDTDNLSCFLWINNKAILPLLYPGRIRIPEQVEQEIIRVPTLQKRLETLQSHGAVQVVEINLGSKEEIEYNNIIEESKKTKLVGDGEAACLVLARFNNGIIASNNTVDISEYCVKYGIIQKRTGDILKEALDKGIITMEEGEQLWSEMRKQKRWLTADTFTEFLKKNYKTN